MTDKRKVKMPRNRAELEELLKNTFLAGCCHGYAIEHTGNVSKQENAGASWWVGEITYEECEKIMNKSIYRGRQQ